jgi:hypothetical protein
MTMAIFAPALAATSFTDVPDSNIFSDDIEWLAQMEITKGCNPPTNDMFCPRDYVTRGQMAAFLVRAIGLTDTGGGNHFTDDDGLVFETDIDRLYTAGITQGCNPPTNDHYCPHSYVTRGQMAAFLVRALGLTATSGNQFTDDNGSVFEASINKLYTAGITMGCNPPANDHYCPDDYVTREQMAAFLRRGFDEAPAQVTGVIATLSGGSGEIDVSWDGLPDPDIDHYNVWYSELPGDTKTLITDPYFGPDIKTGNRWYIIDWPRSLVSGHDCYQVSAVDMGGNEGLRSAEACFDSTPGAPSQVTGVTVGLGGGSGEAYVSWTPNSDPDVDYYNAYYSEFPGGPYTLRTTVAEDVRNGSNRVYFVDFPVDLTVGKTCYEISAVDLSGNEGERSAEACFTP